MSLRAPFISFNRLDALRSITFALTSRISLRLKKSGDQTFAAAKRKCSFAQIVTFAKSVATVRLRDTHGPKQTSERVVPSGGDQFSRAPWKPKPKERANLGFQGRMWRFEDQAITGGTIPRLILL